MIVESAPSGALPRGPRRAVRFEPVAASFFLTLLAVCAFGSALISHVTIDVLGDVLLSDDTYDHVRHGSRIIAFALTGAFASSSLLSVWLAAYRDTLGTSRAFGALLCRLSTRRSRIALALATVVVTPLLLSAMELLDAFVAGQSIDLPSALGGSFVLSLSTTTLVAGILVLVATAAVARLGAAYAALVAAAGEAILALLAAARNGDEAIAERYVAPRIAQAALMSHRAGKRGPPRAFAPRLRRSFN